jgi:quercetin dioxygenase-like cupin family protein
MGVVHRQTGTGPIFRWEGVGVYTYNSNAATKQVLIGRSDGAPNFEVRVFTIPVGGKSSLDEHAHDHGVLIMHGRARVMLGETYEDVQAGDVVYIPSMERHQFENLGDEPFSFLCIIPPKPVQPEAETTAAGAAAPSAG